MGRLDALLQETNALLGSLQQLDDPKIQRDQVIEKIQGQIDRREELMNEISQPYSAEEMKIGQEIIVLNEEIMKRMNHLYEHVKDDLKQVQQRKDQNYSYLNPYGKIKTTDGMYWDNKL